MHSAYQRTMSFGRRRGTRSCICRHFLHDWVICTWKRSRDDPRACTFTLTGKSAMTMKNSRMPADEQRPTELYRPTPLQYFIGACWGVLLVLCVGAEALKTMLG